MAASDMIAEYMAYMDGLQAAIEKALDGRVKRGLIEALKKSAEENVYSYQGNPLYMNQRRGEIAGEDNMYSSVSGTTLILKNMTSLRNGEAGEVSIVEEGTSWGQPRPRPFMEEGLQEYVRSGRAQMDLAQGLAEQGFSASGYDSL